MPTLGQLLVEAPQPALCRGYRPRHGVHDEMCLADGVLRPHWQGVMAMLNEIGPEELNERLTEAHRLLRDNGVTYNVYDDPQDLVRPWRLDLIPWVIAADEWSHIELGLKQRARLLSAILEDVYGPRRLIATGLLPHELVFTHRGFLRPWVGVAQPGRLPLVLYAADLARDADGTIRILGDRTEVPSGSGYALENRIALSRVLPTLFRDTHVCRLAEYFRRLRAILAAMAPRGKDEPRTVLLSPGPRNETYFEHAYLASYLGYTLVEGGDLSVRDGAVKLLTLDGLKPVDVILRRVDDEFCDPLELREDSFLGVPGLIEAVRNRRVSVVNPIGSGVLENPALMAYLPALCRRLLGEELILPPAETWWCGTAQGQDHVLAHLDELVIKPISRSSRTRSVFGAHLSPAQLTALSAEIRARPHLYVGQAQISPSTVPVMVNGELEPRHAVLRCFLSADEDGYTVMPGGLTRVSASVDDAIVTSQRGGASKDTWVIAEGPQQWRSLLPTVRRIATVTAAEAFALPSRVADNLYWLGRYVERTEGVVRLLRVVFFHLTDQFDGCEPGGEPCLYYLLRALTLQTGTWPGFVGTDAEARLRRPEAELAAMVGAPDRTGSLVTSIEALLNTARAVRDQLSVDTWRVIDELENTHRTLRGISPRRLPRAVDELDRLVTALLAFTGLVHDNMTHCPGWRFLDIGRRVERGIHTTLLLRTTLVAAMDERPQAILLESILRVLDSLITYRRRYRASADVAYAVDLMLLDESNPRSIAYQLVDIDRQVARLCHGRAPRYSSPVARIVLKALSALRLADLAALDAVDAESGYRLELDRLLASTGQLLPELSEALTAAYFRHAEQPQQLNPTLT